MATQARGAKSGRPRKPQRASAKQPAIAEPQNAPAPAADDAMLSAKAAAAAEPPKDRDPAQLVEAFRTKLNAVLAKLKDEGTPFKFDEGFRTVARQQWLFGSGRPKEKPYGRPGPVVTYKDGVKELSDHQGNGKAGSGRAADCYPAKANGQIIWPPPPGSDPRWKRYADLAREQGLEAGYYWPTLKDLPHIELK